MVGTRTLLALLTTASLCLDFWPSNSSAASSTNLSLHEVLLKQDLNGDGKEDQLVRIQERDPKNPKLVRYFLALYLNGKPLKEKPTWEATRPEFFPESELELGTDTVEVLLQKKDLALVSIVNSVGDSVSIVYLVVDGAKTRFGLSFTNGGPDGYVKPIVLKNADVELQVSESNLEIEGEKVKFAAQEKKKCLTDQQIGVSTLFSVIQRKFLKPNSICFKF